MTQKSLTFDECKQLSSRLIAMNPNRRANMGQISCRDDDGDKQRALHSSRRLLPVKPCRGKDVF